MWAIIALASLAGLAILALSIPLDMVLHLDVHGKLKFRMRLVWLWGLVSKEIKRRKKKREEKKEVPEKRKPKKRKGRPRDFLKILRTKGLVKQFKRLVKDILSCLRIKNLKGEFKIGLDNPADTGLLFAFIEPIQILNPYLRQQFNLKPSFDEEPVFEGYLQGSVGLKPICLVTPLIRFIFSPVAMRLVKVFILNKWKRRK